MSRSSSTSCRYRWVDTSSPRQELDVCAVALVMPTAGTEQSQEELERTEELPLACTSRYLPLFLPAPRFDAV